MDADVYRQLAEVQEKHWWYEARRRILHSFLHALSLPRNARILEVGCGSGANLTLLRQFGEVKGVEPDAFARDWAKRVSGCEIEDGALPDRLPFTGPFDLLCAFDVIEHVEQDAASLRALRGLVAPGGYALFTVPAYQFLWSGHDVVNQHARRYTRAAFRAKLRAAGFEIVRLSYYNMLLFPLVAAYRLGRKALGVKDGLDTALPSPVVNDVLQKIFAAEAPLLRHIDLPFGVSIIAVCRRPF